MDGKRSRGTKREAKRLLEDQETKREIREVIDEDPVLARKVARAVEAGSPTAKDTR